MEADAVLRGLFNLRSEDGRSGVRVDMLQDGQVRLRVRSPYGTQDALCSTLEEMTLYAAMEPTLNAELYEKLMWELNLTGLRGE